MNFDYGNLSEQLAKADKSDIHGQGEEPVPPANGAVSGAEGQRPEVPGVSVASGVEEGKQPANSPEAGKTTVPETLSGKNE
jgi:hypothetical protein